MTDILRTDDVSVELATVLDQISAISSGTKIKSEKSSPVLNQVMETDVADISRSSYFDLTENKELSTIDPAILDKLASFQFCSIPYPNKEVSKEDFEKLTNLRQYNLQPFQEDATEIIKSREHLSDNSFKSSKEIYEEIDNHVPDTRTLVSSKDFDDEKFDVKDEKVDNPSMELVNIEEDEAESCASSCCQRLINSIDKEKEVKEEYKDVGKTKDFLNMTPSDRKNLILSHDLKTKEFSLYVQNIIQKAKLIAEEKVFQQNFSVKYKGDSKKTRKLSDIFKVFSKIVNRK